MNNVVDIKPYVRMDGLNNDCVPKSIILGCIWADTLGRLNESLDVPCSTQSLQWAVSEIKTFLELYSGIELPPTLSLRINTAIKSLTKMRFDLGRDILNMTILTNSLSADLTNWIRKEHPDLFRKTMIREVWPQACNE